MVKCWSISIPFPQ